MIPLWGRGLIASYRKRQAVIRQKEDSMSINTTYLGELLTGVVIAAGAIPSDLHDANGTDIRGFIIQTVHDIADELELGREVNWDAVSEPANVAVIERDTLHEIQSVAQALKLALEGTLSVESEGDRDE